MTVNHSADEPLTRSAQGHTLHHNGIFSPDGHWVVFDGRNDDTKIGENGVIGLVNVLTGEEKVIYRVENQTVYGPGVGAVSFSPTNDFVIFIHGLHDADREKPYAITRRTGVGVDIHQPFHPVNMDARDKTAPYTPGSLRGGTHSHAWSSDGRLISYTYNDEQADPDLRVVGVMVPHEGRIEVDRVAGNNPGTYYSAIVTEVVREPVPGSDEISRAFDECWVDGSGQTPYRLAFQGNVCTAAGKTITEVFLVDLDPDRIRGDSAAAGREGERPRVPAGIKQRRLTFTENGISDTRHWLRADPEGKYIYALAKDEQGRNQIWRAEVESGRTEWISRNDFSIDYTFNFDRQGRRICFVALNRVGVFDLEKQATRFLTPDQAEGKIVGAPSFSPDNAFIVYNQYRKHDDGAEYLQIMTVKLKD